MAEIIYVVNKSDLEETDASMNCSDEDEDLVDGETGARRGKKTKEMSSTARFGELEVIMNKLKQLKYLDKDNKFNKSENFHCVSSKVVGSARRKTSKGKPLNDSDVLFLKTYKRFHECLLKRLHQIMRDLEEAVRQRIHNLLHSFLNLLGTNRIGIMKALRDMEDFIASARTAEGYLHDHKRFHKLFDSVLTGGVITGALETAKLEVERFAEEPQELWSLDEISHDPKRWVWLTRFGLRVHMPSESLEEQEVLRTKLKAVSFVIEAERVVVRSISKAVVEHVEEALTANAGEFQKIINAARSKNVEILNRLFDQAYRVQHGKGDFDGVKKMHDIVNWAPIRATIWETMRCYGEEIFHQTKMRHTNFARWRTELINMVFNQFDAEKIGSLLREGCSRRLNEMHQEFVKITSRVKNLRDAVTEKGSESIKVMESTVKPRLLLHVCEVASIEFDRNHQGEFEAGRWIGKDGDFTVHECPANRDWVIYVAKKCDFPGDKEWLKVVEHVFFADEMRKRTCRPHPHLVNCHGFWMPDRETFNVAFDRVDVTLTEYLNTKCLPLKERLRLALKIARVLALIHNVVHLCHPDLRISNIMVKEDEPKLLHCCSKSPFEPVMVEKDGKKVQMLPFHLHPDFKSIERSESAAYMDCYSYGMLLWLLTKGSPEAYPEVFTAYDAIEKLSGIRQVWDVKIIPEEPDGLPGEEDLVKKLYELMKLLWTSKDIRMDLVADHLEYLLDMRNDSVLVDCYPELK